MKHTTQTKKIFALGLLLTSTSILQATQKEEYTLPNGYYHIILTNTSYSNHLLAFNQQEENNNKEKIKKLVIYVHTLGETHKPKDKHVSFYLEQEKKNHNTKAPTYTLRLDKDNTNSYALFYTQGQKLVLSQKNKSSFLLQEMDKKYNNLTNLNPLIYQDKKNTYLLKLVDKKSKKEILGNGFIPQSIKNNTLVTTIQSPCILSLADYHQLPKKINLPSIQQHHLSSSINSTSQKLTIEDMLEKEKCTEIKNHNYYAIIWKKKQDNVSAIAMNTQDNVLASITQNENKNQKNPIGNLYEISFLMEQKLSKCYHLIVEKKKEKEDYYLTKENYLYFKNSDDDDETPHSQFFSFKKIKKENMKEAGFSEQLYNHKKIIPVVLYGPDGNPIKNSVLRGRKLEKEEQGNSNSDNSNTIILSSISLLLYHIGHRKPPKINLFAATNGSGRLDE